MQGSHSLFRLLRSGAPSGKSNPIEGLFNARPTISREADLPSVTIPEVNIFMPRETNMMTRENDRTFPSRLAVVLFACVVMFVSARRLQAQRSYRPPQTPIAIPSEVPTLTADIHVDDFIRVADARTLYQVTGRNLSVVVIDTGINSDHVDFTGKILPGSNFTANPPNENTTDLDGHGSNVAGIIAGRAIDLTESIATRSRHQGIAPDAKIISLKVFPGGEYAKINAALQWVIDHQSVDHISAVNMSLGSAENLTGANGITDPDETATQQLIRQLRQMNVAVIVAAGNNYFAFNRRPDAAVPPVPARQGMGFPAICQETVSVGAVFDRDQQTDTPGLPLRMYMDGAIVNFAVRGRVTPFSQRLSDSVGHSYRTDIFAPGFDVVSAGPATPSTPAVGKTNQTLDDGTSQAAPVATGVVLLLQQYFHDHDVSHSLPSVDLIEECLREGGVSFVDVLDNNPPLLGNVVTTGTSFKALNALGALRYLQTKLDSSPIPPAAAVAVIQRRYQDLAGTNAAAPETLVQEVLQVAKRNGQIDSRKAVSYLEEKYRQEANTIKSRLLRARGENRASAETLKGTSILGKTLQ
jgi:subtilisin family serine protease